MSIHLRAELQTDVVGGGDGTITITQIDELGRTQEVYLTVNQFERIFNHEKHIVREAMGTE
jgi:hypothetical protein